MNTTDQLPEPELGYIKTDKSNQPAFSARQMREALQARAQVQGDVCPTCGETEPYTGSCGTSNNDTKALCKQPLRATQAEVTDGIRPEDFTVDVIVKPMGGFAPVNTQGVRVTHKPTGISVTCDAARSQHANRQQAFEKLSALLSLRPERVPMTDEQISLEAHNADEADWNDLRFRSSWHEGFLEGARFAEAHHGIKPKEQA